MWKKLLMLSLCIAMLFVFSAPITPVNAGDNSVNINWQIAGSIVQFIDINVLVVPPSGSPYFESAGMHSLINLSAQGAPGPAKITLLSQTGASGSSFGCISSNYFVAGYFKKNDFVALFPDHSLLFASIHSEGGTLCMGIPGTDAEGTTYFIVKMDITGGKGRFEGATGDFTAEGYGYPGFSSDVTLVGENGTVKGTIDLP